MKSLAGIRTSGAWRKSERHQRNPAGKRLFYGTRRADVTCEWKRRRLTELTTAATSRSAEYWWRSGRTPSNVAQGLWKYEIFAQTNGNSDNDDGEVSGSRLERRAFTVQIWTRSLHAWEKSSLKSYERRESLMPRTTRKRYRRKIARPLAFWQRAGRWKVNTRHWHRPGLLLSGSRIDVAGQTQVTADRL